MKMLRVTALTAFLLTSFAAAQADEIRLDDSQLDAVAAGFLDFSGFTGLLRKGLANPGQLDLRFGSDLLRALLGGRGGVPIEPPYTNGGHGAAPA